MDILNLNYNKNVPPEQEDRRTETKKFLDTNLYRGAKVLIRSDELTQLASRGTKTVSASVYSRGKNLSREIVERDYAPERDDGTAATMDVKGQGGILTRIWEYFAHLDTPVNTKFLNVRSPSEEWNRSYMYGTQSGGWDNPIRDWLKPMTWSLMGKDPISAAIRGAWFGSAFTLMVPDIMLLNRGWRYAKRELGQDESFLRKAGSALKYYFVGKETTSLAALRKDTGGELRKLLGGYLSHLTGAKVGALFGLGVSTYAMLRRHLWPNSDNGAYIPRERRHQYEIEEYWDKLMYVKHEAYRRSYQRQALDNEGRILKLVLPQLKLPEEEALVWA
jgi:hypothetical protein